MCFLFPVQPVDTATPLVSKQKTAVTSVMQDGFALQQDLLVQMDRVLQDITAQRVRYTDKSTNAPKLVYYILFYFFDYFISIADFIFIYIVEDF